MVLAPRSARAEAPAPTLSVQVSCPDLDEDEVRRVLSATLLLTSSRHKAGLPTHVSCRCQGSSAALRIDDSLTGKSLARTVDLDRVDPKAQSRLLGLAMAEFVWVGWSEIDPNPTSIPAAAGEPHAPRPPERAFVAAPQGLMTIAWPGVSLGAAATVRSSVVHPILELGGSVTFAAGSVRSLRWMGDVSFEGGSTRTHLGRISSQSASAGIYIGTPFAERVVNYGLGVGVRGGFTWFRGRSDDPSKTWQGQVSGGWLGPSALFQLQIALSHRVEIALVPSFGLVVAPVRASENGEERASFGPLWVATQASIGFLL